jgi:hypothetical protein
LGGASKVLAVLLLAYVVADILLTPLAHIETRDPARVTHLGVAALVLLFAGLLLAVVSVVFLVRGSRRSSATAVVAAILYFPAPITEWSGRFSALKPPTAIATIEVAQTLIAVLVIAVAVAAARPRATL